MTDALRVPELSLRLPEQLMLLSLQPSGFMKRRQEMRFGIAGAALLELLLAERIDLRGRDVVVLRTEPLGHPTCDLALRMMADSPRARSTVTWLKRLEKKVIAPTGEILAQARLASRSSLINVGSVQWYQYRPVPGHVAGQLKQNVGLAMLEGTSDERTTALTLLLDAVHLLRDVVPSVGRAQRTARLWELTAASYMAPQLQTAVTALKHEIESAEGAAA